MDNKKQYTGTWIPRHVMEDEELKATDRILYAEIASYEICYASNAMLAARVNLGERGLQKAVKRLIDSGYVMNVGFNGRQRFLQAVYNMAPKPGNSDTNKQTSHEPEFVAETNSSTSIDNNEKTIEKTKEKKKISEDEKLDIEKLYRGWLIEMVIGFAVWQGFQDDPQARRDYLATARKKVRLTEKRRQKMLSRLRELGMADCIKAIKNVASASDFYRGNNENKWKATIEWLFNSTEKTEEWANK